MGFLDRLDHRVEFLLLRLIHGVVQVFSDHGTVRRDLDNVHAVDLAELLLLCQSGTGHTCLLVILVEEILEGDIRQRLALALHLHMLLGLNRLVQTVGIAAARHNAARELVYDQHLIVLHHIILIPEHQIVGPQSQNDVVLDLQILRIRQVVNMEILLHPLYAVGSQVYNLILFIDDEISGLGDLLAHDGVHLGKLSAGLAPLHGFRQDVADLVELRGLAALAGNDKRRSRLVDQDRVHLVDDGVVEGALHQLLLVNHHVVAQIVKAQLVVRHIGDVAGVCRPSLVVRIPIQDHAYRQSQSLVDLAHPLRVTVRQVVVHRHDMDALALQGVQVSRKRGHQRLSFAGLHLGDTSLMQDNSADQLHPVMLHAKHAPGRLAHCREGLYQQIIQRLAVRQALFKFSCLSLQLLIRKLHHLRPEGLDLIHQRINELQLTLRMRTENLCQKTHLITPILTLPLSVRRPAPSAARVFNSDNTPFCILALYGRLFKKF